MRTPWTLEPQAQYLGSFHELAGDACIAEPRHALRKVIERFAELKLTPVAAVELEFYLLDRESALAGKPQPPKGLTGGGVPKHWQAYAMPDLDDFAPFFRDLYAAANVQGVPAEALISEYSPGQMEIGLRHHADALKACDEAMMFKRAVKGIADAHGLMATFMAKPYSAYSGSRHAPACSLAGVDGKNAFASEEAATNSAAPRHRRHEGNDGRRHGHLCAERQLVPPLPQVELCADRAELGHQQPHGFAARAGRRAARTPR